MRQPANFPGQRVTFDLPPPPPLSPAGDVLYELLQHILKQRKAHVLYPSAYYPGSSFSSLPESAVQHLKLEGQCPPPQQATSGRKASAWSLVWPD